MSDLVDRAARIINPQFDSFGHLGAAYVRQYQDETRAKVRAVLAAMRDPTEEMLAAVVARPDALIEERTEEGYEGYAERMDAAVAAERMALAGRWRAMIDAAILE